LRTPASFFHYRPGATKIAIIKAIVLHVQVN